MEKHAQEAGSPQTPAEPFDQLAQLDVAAGSFAVRAVTISHLYGSGGGEIGARLAQRLGWKLIDHEIVAQVAEKMGISLHEADARDEYPESFFARLLSTIQVTLGAPPSPASLAVPVGELHTAYQQTIATLVEAAADQGHAVIIGRGSQVVLANRRDVLHVRIVAPLPQRIDYVAKREGIGAAEARTRIQLKDRVRARYLRTEYHQESDNPLLYDLVVNTVVLDLDSVVTLIQHTVEAKSAKEGVPADELGPAAGLNPYPGEPEDLPPP